MVVIMFLWGSENASCSSTVNVPIAALNFSNISITDSSADCTAPCNGGFSLLVGSNRTGSAQILIVGQNTGITQSAHLGEIGPGVSAFPNFSSLCPDNYLVTATLQGCTSLSQIITVGGMGTPQGSIIQDKTSVCAGSSATLTAYPFNGSYQWTTPQGTSTSNPLVISSASESDQGNYSVAITYAGCPTSASTSLAVTTISATLSPSNQVVNADQIITLTANSVMGASYSLQTPNRGSMHQTSNIFNLDNAQPADTGD